MTQIKIPFALKSIETLEFATFDKVYKDGDEVGIETNFNFGVSREEHSLAVHFSLVFICHEKPFIKLKLACDFDIEPLSFKKFTVMKSNSLKVPKSFFTHLSVLTVGTARGVLHAKLENTEYDHFLLPTLNISEMIKEDVEFSA
ncbi:hypothetical protein E1176_07045 [Fulvivirga sp. RKSG066]|uniref:hypothetical protein n=1 Tax=Fulvivirga aurantia TaxID=2529383 RepID=UPI0012BCD9BF|nr:hypothetical protein [Fulvivirga aurantia]MTI20772.1 hypothetical protein [Fulvivirga aurantia]